METLCPNCIIFHSYARSGEAGNSKNRVTLITNRTVWGSVLSILYVKFTDLLLFLVSEVG